MVFLSEELGRLLGSLSIYLYFSARFSSWWLVCEVVLTIRTLSASWTPYLFLNLVDVPSPQTRILTKIVQFMNFLFHAQFWRLNLGA